MCRAIKISPRIWNDAQFASLSDRGKLAYFFVLTHPHMTAIGAMRHTLPGIAAELGWKLRACREAFLELAHRGLVHYSETAPIMWLPNFLQDNRPESPVAIQSWAEILEILPDCPERSELLRGVQDDVEGMGEAFLQALPEGFRQGLPEALHQASPVPAELPVTKTESPPPESRPAPSTQAPSRPLLFDGHPEYYILVPRVLRTNNFLEAWHKWQRHCHDYRGGLSLDAAEMTLQILRKAGSRRSVKLIEIMIARSLHSIELQRQATEREPSLCAAGA